MFKPNTVDSILKDFTVKVVQLQAIATRKLQDAELYAESVEVAKQLEKESLAEAARATNVAEKIKALVA